MSYIVREYQKPVWSEVEKVEKDQKMIINQIMQGLLDQSVGITFSEMRNHWEGLRVSFSKFFILSSLQCPNNPVR